MFAVKFYKDMPEDTPEVVAGIPLDWIAELIEIGDSTTPPDETAWTIFSPEDHKNHTEFYSDSYRAWLEIQPGYKAPQNPEVSPSILPVTWAFAELAQTGKYLELFPGVDGFATPFIVAVSQLIRAISFSCDGPTTSQVGVFIKSDLDNPILTIALENQDIVQNKRLSCPVSPDSSILVRILDGSCNKPKVALYIGE